MNFFSKLGTKACVQIFISTVLCNLIECWKSSHFSRSVASGDTLPGMKFIEKGFFRFGK